MSATEHRLSTAGGALECWSFVSDGLAALGQKELVFTFARQRDESIDPLAGQVGRLLITIHSLAAAGRIVEIGSFTEFGERRFLGSVAPAASHTCAPSLWRASPFPTARSPRYQLMGDEVETLKHFGMTRVAARLGERYRYYPWPPWWDRDRAGLTSVPQGAAMEEVYLSFAKTSSESLKQQRRDPVLRQNLIPLSGRRSTLSRQAKERLGDCRQEGRPQCGSVGPPLKDAEP